jgi:hypothetical protein
MTQLEFPYANGVICGELVIDVKRVRNANSDFILHNELLLLLRRISISSGNEIFCIANNCLNGFFQALDQLCVNVASVANERRLFSLKMHVAFYLLLWASSEEMCEKRDD